MKEFTDPARQYLEPGSMTKGGIHRGCRPLFSLADGNPDGLAFVLGFDDFLLQAVEPDAAVEDFADLAIFANENAAFGIY